MCKEDVNVFVFLPLLLPIHRVISNFMICLSFSPFSIVFLFLLSFYSIYIVLDFGIFEKRKPAFVAKNHLTNFGDYIDENNLILNENHKHVFVLSVFEMWNCGKAVSDFFWCKYSKKCGNAPIYIIYSVASDCYYENAWSTFLHENSANFRMGNGKNRINTNTNYKQQQQHKQLAFSLHATTERRRRGKTPWE